MVTVAKRIAATALALGAVAWLAQPAQAQTRIYGQIPYPINPNPMIAPGVSLQQFAYNTSVIGKAYRHIPPYLLGYNPYPVAVNYGPVYNPQVFRPAVYNPYSPPLYGSVVPPGVPYAGGYSPGYGGNTPYYGGNAYTGGYTPGGIDPLTGLPVGSGGYDPYSGGYSPWNPYGGYSGGYLYGSAAFLEAYGRLGMDMEKARILREQAEQAKLDTRKKLVDTLAYIRANEYTFTQEQADIAKKILDRVQKTPTTAEVTSGKSLNILLNNLALLSDAKIPAPATVTLDDDILKLVNVTGQQKAGGSVNIGLLRDNGRFAWPSVFDEKSIIGDKERKDIELHAQELFQQAVNSKIDKNTLRDINSALRGLRETLNKNVNQVPTQNYLEGVRFLDSFDAAIAALERGDAVLNLDYQQKFAAKGGKTVAELVDYMKRNGLQFAPSNPGDERAYQALQAALAANSLAVSTQIADNKR
jgi:hypothetical protein